MKRSLLKLLCNSGVINILRYFKYRNKLITILCLHRVSDDDSVTFHPIKPKDFERLLQYISRHYQVLTIATLHHLKNTKPAIILSFDDGFLDFYENGLPLLKKYEMPCNLNVITNCLDNNFQIWTQRQNNLLDQVYLRRQKISFDLDGDQLIIDQFSQKNVLQKSLQLFKFLFTKSEMYVDDFLKVAENKFPFPIPPTAMMSWDNLADALQKYDIELGSHSVSHINMANIVSAKKLFDEVNNSKLLIEEKTGKTVNIFAFPNGSYSDNVLEACEIAGYLHVLTVDEILFSSKNRLAFKLPRLLIAYKNYYENLLKTENFQNAVKRIISKKTS